MVFNCKTHLSVLQAAAAAYGPHPAFRVPQPSSNGSRAWGIITFAQLLHDVELVAKYWSRTLRAQGIPTGSVVGLWIGGMTYADLVQIYGVSRAGYVPQLFSLRLPNPTVIVELLTKAHARAIICEPSYFDVIRSHPVKSFLAADLHSLKAYSTEQLPPLAGPRGPDEVMFVFHTSGSTSGSPKLVPCRAAWVESMINKSYQVSAPRSRGRQDTSTWMGSMCHIGQSFMFLGSMQHGSCTIQPTRIDFSSEELSDMIYRCSLNRLHQFAAFLVAHLRNARQNPKLLSLIQSLDMVVYSGLPLENEEEEFALRSGVNLVNLFGSTECGAMMMSGGTGPSARLLRPLAGVNYAFVPISSASAKPESGHTSANSQLLELVILSSSPDCPSHSLRSHSSSSSSSNGSKSSDGHFHTGDLFEQILPSQYLFRGRDDDWIKSLNSLRCDTRSIEDNVRATCPELVSECIVVGTGRVSPALFVEPATGMGGEMDQNQLKREILRRTRNFHSRRYLHERITSVKFIVVVPPRTLPRTATKGNIRRQAVEEKYRALLDSLYESERL